MAGKKPLVTILRREASELAPEVIAALKQAFGEGVEFRRTDPADYLEHSDQCRELGPEVVYLPDKPIPSKAMQEGVVHVFYMNGQLMKLEPLVPKFAPFVPNTTA